MKKYYLDNRDRVEQYYSENRDRKKEYQLKNHDKIIPQKKIYPNKKNKTDKKFCLIRKKEVKFVKHYKEKSNLLQQKIF